MKTPTKRDYDPDWFREARYGQDSAYRKTCEVVHESTGGHCTRCGRPSQIVHHGLYWAWWQVLLDLWAMLRQKPLNAPWWLPNGRGKRVQKLGGLTQGRERPGVTAFPLCKRCHTVVHEPRHWIRLDGVSRCWHNRQRPWMLWQLRVLWWLRRARHG